MKRSLSAAPGGCSPGKLIQARDAGHEWGRSNRSWPHRGPAFEQSGRRPVTPAPDRKPSLQLLTPPLPSGAPE